MNSNMEKQSDRPERTLEQNRKMLEALQRAQSNQIAEHRRQVSPSTSEDRKQVGSESRFLNQPRRENVERLDGMELERRRLGHYSADEVASLRLSRPSEMRADAAALWEPVHRRNHTEFIDGVAKHRLQKSEDAEARTVWSDQIAPLSITAPEQNVLSEKFWHHHDNGPDYYRRMGESYPKLREQLKSGKTLKELAKDPDLKDAAKFWYGEPPLKLEHYRDSYFCDESGHHRVALAHQYQLEEIPAQVREWKYRELPKG
jgi:hypothetical protein